MVKKIMQLFLKDGDLCIQCKQGTLQSTGEKKHGDRILSCVRCGWRVRENT